MPTNQRKEQSSMPEGDIRPNPDPTALTTQSILREVTSVDKVLTIRIDSTNSELDRVREVQRVMPSQIEKQILHLRELHEERFSSIQTQFNERDTRTEQTSRDSKVAVDAALQAAKEAVGEQNKSSAMAIAKSEAATTKQIDQIQILIQTGNKATDDKVNDIKDRLTAIEGHSQGLSDGWGWIVGAIGMIGGIIGVVMTLVSAWKH